MRAILASFVFVLSIGACGPDRQHNGGDDDAHMQDACVGLECQVVNCMAMGMPDTSVSGTVFAPNGTLPLFGISVYVPRDPITPFVPGVSCDQCSASLPGSPIVTTTTDEMGHFSLQGIPAGDNIPVVVTIGKWRRQLVVPHAGQCADTPIAPTDTSLPKNKAQGEIPQIAISTGSADALECLPIKLGIDPAEFTADSGAGRVHMYTDTQSAGQGADRFAAGGNFTDSQALWGNVNKLKNYDIVIFSCEGDQFGNTKPQPSLNAVQQYADVGGRVFLSHWHNIWIEGANHGQGANGQVIPDWAAVATFDNGGGLGNGSIDLIDEANNSKGTSFATWMINVMGSTVRDQVPIQDMTGKTTASAIDNGKGERWVYINNRPQNFQFTTPQNVAADARCGKVVFSDMHVSGDSSSAPGGGAAAFPNGCAASGLTPQEKALAFMFFDISSCVGVIF